MKQRLARFARQVGDDVPVILGGDFNAQPISSVMSLMHDEDIVNGDPEKNPNLFQIPNNIDAGKIQYYRLIADKYQRSRHANELAPLVNNLDSVYNKYRPGTTRTEQQPDYTNYTSNFKGTLDHIFVNDRCEVV